MRVRIFEKKKPLDSSLNDFIITKTGIKERPKKLVSFCVIQTYFFEGKSHEIIKFDTAHGECHVHRNYKRLNHREPLQRKDISTAAFNECRKEIENNWKKYKEWYIKKWFK